MIALTRQGVATALLVVAALFVGSLVTARLPQPDALLDRPFEHHGALGAPVMLRTGTVSVTGLRSGTQASGYLDVAVTRAIWLVTDLEWTPARNAAPLNSLEARIIAPDGRQFGGAAEVTPLCSRTQTGVTFVCSIAFEMDPTAVAGASLHVPAAGSIDDADDVAVIDLGLDAERAATLTSATGRVALAEAHAKEG